MTQQGFSGTTIPLMHISELDFNYPEHLIATERQLPSRVMCVRAGEPSELPSPQNLLAEFQSGDVLVLNDTRVLKRRVFSENGLEILFLKDLGERRRWEVLFPSSRVKAGASVPLPGGVELHLVSRGRPQVIETSAPLSEAYFLEHGELPLPPYIQKARGERHNRSEDRQAYQTAWAQTAGSLAAPTASFHFSLQDLEFLKEKGVTVVFLTLHVGLGTFLPISVENLDEHPMHEEVVAIPAETWAAIQMSKAHGGRIWALGTTVTRALESAAQGRLPQRDEGFFGGTDLFIRPGFEFRVVDVLMTNFHQPKSTLLALVGAFAGLDTVQRCYQWAIEREFRLFSYGDLTVWMKS